MPALVRNKATTSAKAVPPKAAPRSKKAATSSSTREQSKPTETQEDDLAQKLAAVRLEGPSTGPSTSRGKTATDAIPRTTSSRNVPASKAQGLSKAASSSKPKPSTPSTTEDTNASNGAGSSRTGNDPQVDEAERLNLAMKAFNSASSSLSAVVQAGWKASKAPPPSTKPSAKAAGKRPAVPSDPPSGPEGYTLEAVRRMAVSCQIALRDVRTTGKGRRPPMDFEKAAGALVAKLITLELYDVALSALEDMKPGLMAPYVPTPTAEDAAAAVQSEQLCPPSRPKSKATSTSRSAAARASPSLLSTHQTLHGLPLPPEGSQLDEALPNLVLNFHLHSLTAMAKVANKDADPVIEKVINQPGNFFDWYPFYVASKVDTAKLSGALNQAARLVTSVDGFPAYSLFKIRLWAMKCLIVCNMLDPATFWNQATKCAKVFAKAVEAKDDPESDVANAKHVSAFFETLVQTAKEMPSLQQPGAMTAQTMLQGPGFASACEYWTRFARFLNDVDLMTRISSLLEEPADEAKSDEPAEASTKTIPGNSSMSAAQCCLTLQRAATVLSSGTDNGTEHLTAASGVLPRCLVLLTKGKEDEASVKNVFRALDEVGAACENLLQSELKDGKTSSMTEAAKTLLEGVVKLREDILQKRKGDDSSILYADRACEDLLCGTLDGLFLLSKLILRPKAGGKGNPAVVKPAYSYLQRAITLARITKDSAPAGSSALPPKIQLRYAETLRSTSGAFHNAAAQLINGGNEAASAPFWNSAAKIGQEALAWYDDACKVTQTDEQPVEKQDPEAWKALRERHIPSRLELCGYALARGGDRRAAYDAYVRAVCATPRSSLDKLVSASRSQPVRSVMQSEPRLAAILEKLTSLATYDLFLLQDGGSESGTLRRPLEQAGVPLEVIGAILEFQVLILDPVIHKEDAAVAVRTLLKELKDIYSGAGEYPIRRARVLLRILEYAYSLDDANLAGSPMVVTGLLGTQNLGRDTQLSSFVPQYTLSLEILLTLQAHRRQDAEDSTTIILQHANKAIKALRGMVTQPAEASPAKAGSSKKTSASAKDSKPNGRSTVTKPKGGTSRNQKPAKTPKKPSAIEGLTKAMANLQVEVPQFHAIVLDDEDRFYRKLESLSNLLGLLGHVFHRVELLDIMRTLCQKTSFSGKIDSFVLTSVAIAQEYVKIGKLDRAVATYEQAGSSPSVDVGSMSTEVRAIFLLRWAEAVALTECTDEALLKYGEAVALSETLAIPDKTAPTIVRARSRITALERSALAATVYAAIQLSRDNTTTAISGLMQALRLWNRALETLTKLRQPALPASSSSPNPFQVSAEDQAISSGSKPGSPRIWDAMMDGLHWRLADGVVTGLFALGRLHHIRGSVKNSEFFTQRANELATSLNAPLLISRALAKEAEKELAVGRLDTGHDLLVQAAYHWEQIPDVLGPDLADLHRLQGNYSLRNEEPEEAKRIYGVASQLLNQLEKTFAETEASLVTPSSGAALTSDGAMVTSSVAPAVLASVLRQHIWLLRTEAGEDPMYDDLLNRFLALPACVEAKVEENALMGKLALEEVQARLEADLFLSSLTESAMVLPMGMSSSDGIAPPTSTRDILASVINAEKFFWTGLELSGSRGEVQQVREAALSLGLLRAFQTSLGKGGKNNALIAAALLDISVAVTLRREMLECIDNKFPNISQASDLAWPTMNANGSPFPATQSGARRLLFAPESDDEDDDSDETSMQAYWQMVKKRYRSETLDPEGLACSTVDLLPEHWTVVNISVTDDKQTLFISRQRARREPLIFCLPLDRQGRREMGEDEDEQLTYEQAVEELQDIIRLNDETAKNAKDIQDKDGRASWWSDRGQLDVRLKELLENIEFCWLGAFKTILAEPSDISVEALNSLRTKIDKVFKRNRVVPQDKKSNLHLRLDDAIVECFSNLSPKCRDEEIEDLIYFVLDLYQLHGAPIALSEIDLDQASFLVVVDLRTVLEEYSAKSRRESTTHPDHHLFLVLDKNLQGLPWESIPVLRGRSVSRIPSISFLLDRVDLVRYQQGQAIASRSSTGAPPPDRTTVDPLKTFYVLNPSGDLKTTQTTFEPKFKELEKLGWKGIAGRPPTEEEMLQGFQRSDLVLYFGHAAGHQYVRSHKIRNLPRCAATMLWGCSSGALREMGDFERIGTPNHYMLAGCPTLVANLWDVTDREIDRVASAVLSKLRIDGDHLNAKGKNKNGDSSVVSVVQAVAEARESCKLKYLTGAAPVVYGIPFYL